MVKPYQHPLSNRPRFNWKGYPEEEAKKLETYLQNLENEVEKRLADHECEPHRGIIIAEELRALLGDKTCK